MSPEQELVNRFLEAVDNGDRPTIASLSVRGFDESMDSWEILEVQNAATIAYPVPVLREEVLVAEEERDEQFKIYSEFRQSNYDQLARIQKAQQNDPDYRFSDRLEALRVEWESQRSERREKVRQLQQAEIALANEVKTMTKSLQRESTPEYLTGEVLNRRVLVSIVRQGQLQEFVFTISKYDLTNQFDAAVPSGWIVTEIEAAAGASPPV